MKKENIKTIILGIFIIAVILFSNYLGYIRAINNNNLVNRKYFQEIDNTDMLIDLSVDKARKEYNLSKGDLVVVAASVPANFKGHTNMLKVHEV